MLLFSFCVKSHPHELVKREASDEALKIVGFRIEEAEKEPQLEDGVPVLRADTKVTLRLFGNGFTNRTTIGLTAEKMEYMSHCTMMVSTGYFKIIPESSTNAKVEILLPKHSSELFICATNDAATVSLNLGLYEFKI